MATNYFISYDVENVANAGLGFITGAELIGAGLIALSDVLEAVWPRS